MIGARIYHWWCPRCEVRKFSDDYRLTYLYAFRRLGKALRRFRSTIVELLTSDILIRRS